MKKFYLYSLFFFVAAFAKAQQIGMYSHFFFKPMVYNPAFTGTGDATNAMLISRSQWTGFKGAPQLNLFTLDGNLLNKKVGLGIGLISDRKGLSNRVGGDLSYSYRLVFSDDMYALLGVSAGIIDQSMDYAQAEVQTASDPTLFTGLQRKTTFDASAGIAFVYKDFKFGAAVPQLAGNKIKYVDNTDVRTYYTQARHYMGTLEYKFMLSKEKEVSLTPMMLLRYVAGAPVQYDGNLDLDWKDKCWIGATYKSDYAVSANIGVCLYKQLSIGYSYDFIIGTIGKYAGMSSEVMVNFKFGKNKKKLPENETPFVEAPVPASNSNYQHQLDSLQNELHNSQNEIKQNQQKIKELNDKLNGQPQTTPVTTQTATPSGATVNTANAKAAMPTGENQNAAALATNANKTMENGVWIVTDKRSDFKDVNNNIPAKGFYVIAGTFFYQDFADAEAKRLNVGNKGTSRIYSETKKYNYIFISRFDSKDTAVKKANDAKLNGLKDAWVLDLE